MFCEQALFLQLISFRFSCPSSKPSLLNLLNPLQLTDSSLRTGNQKRVEKQTETNAASVSVHEHQTLLAAGSFLLRGVFAAH